jgi:DNA-directed RNA polymerase subunit RPC12/RpoP
MIPNIEHEFTKNVVCPYCGFENKDSWELEDWSDNYECPNCEEKFSFTRYVETYYSSKRRT